MTINVSRQKRQVCISLTGDLKQRPFEEQILNGLQNASLLDLDSVRDEFLEFDLGESYWYDLGALLWFVSLLHKLKKQGCTLGLKFPQPKDTKGEKLWDFLIRWRFFEALSECVADPVNLLEPEQVPHMRKQSGYRSPMGVDEYGQEAFLHSSRILEITTIPCGNKEPRDETTLGSFLEKYNDKIIISALSQHCAWDYSLTKTFVQRTVSEGIHNSFLHSKGSFANISMRLDAKNLTLAISDNGIGIPKVLRDAFRQTYSREDLLKASDVDLIKYFTEPDMILDSQLIEFSTQRGVTSNVGRRGIGLYYLKSVVLNQKGELRIRSGTACVDFTQSKVHGRDNMLNSPGTMLRIITPLKR
jgi:hypothetical protein